MTLNHDFIIVITTCPNEEDAIATASALLEKRLAACIQQEEIKSTYRWKEKVETDREIRLMIKTRSVHFEKISRILNQTISYETPEIIAVPIINGSHDYLSWIKAQTE